MAATEKPAGLALLRQPFPEHQISKLPKPTAKQTQLVRDDFKNGIRCAICGAWHHKDVVHLDYVGHAALTDRLLDCDPAWNWEPVSFGDDGTPRRDANGGMWIKLTVCGVTRLGYGHADGKAGGDAVKEVIGDALRNAAMRFGAALDLWHKGQLHTDPPAAEPPHDPETGEIIPAANHGSAIRSAWEDGIRDGLPADATERQFFEACVAQLTTEWRNYKTLKGLEGGWAKYEALLTRMQHEATDLWEDLMAIWQRAKDALEEAAETKAAEKAPPTISKATGEAILAGIHALKTVEACDMFEKGLRDGPNPGALAHPKIKAALQFKRSVLMGEADPVVVGEVRVG